MTPYRALRAQTDPARQLGWASAETQAVHLSTLFGMLGPLDGRSVLDVGCGHGDAVPFCGENYVGIDSQADAVAVARRRHPGRLFLSRDALSPAVPLPAADVVVLCGTLALQTPHAAHRLVTRALAAARHAVALTVWTGAAETPADRRVLALIGGMRGASRVRLELQTAYFVVRT